MRFRAKIGAARFRDLMANVPGALEEIRSPDQRVVAEFYIMLGGDNFRAVLAEIAMHAMPRATQVPSGANWIDVVCERPPP